MSNEDIKTITDPIESRIEYHFTEYPIVSEGSDSGTVEMRTIVLGSQPLILIEPTEGEGEGIVVNIAASEIDLEGMEVILKSVLRATQQALRLAE